MSIKDGAGHAVVGAILQVSEEYGSKLAIIDFPTADKDLLQSFGTKNRRFKVKFFTTGSSYYGFELGFEDGFERKYDRDGLLKCVKGALLVLVGTSGSLQTHLIPNISVLYNQVAIKTLGKRPLEFDAELELTEII